MNNKIINVFFACFGIIVYICTVIMNKIKNIAFDLGGVVLALSYEQAVRRFEEIGLADARQRLDAFEQKGIFGDLESGRITAEDFRRELSKLVGRELTAEDCSWAWHGYVVQG